MSCGGGGEGGCPVGRGVSCGGEGESIVIVINVGCATCT